MRTLHCQIDKYRGIDYRVEVESFRHRKRYVFSIIAIHRRSRRWSRINTLNTILSWFEIEGDSSRASQSDWLVTAKRLAEFREKSQMFFTDRTSLVALENHLDEDRIMCGEWANVGKRPYQ